MALKWWDELDFVEVRVHKRQPKTDPWGWSITFYAMSRWKVGNYRRDSFNRRGASATQELAVRDALKAAKKVLRSLKRTQGDLSQLDD